MALSRSKRIAIGLSVLWLPAGFWLGSNYGVHEGDWAAALLEHCKSNSSDWAACLAAFNHDYYLRNVRLHLWYGWSVAVVPILLAWCLAFIRTRIKRSKAGLNALA